MHTKSSGIEWNFSCVVATTNYVHSGNAGAYDTDSSSYSTQHKFLNCLEMTASCGLLSLELMQNGLPCWVACKLNRSRNFPIYTKPKRARYNPLLCTTKFGSYGDKPRFRCVLISEDFLCKSLSLPAPSSVAPHVYNTKPFGRMNIISDCEKL